MESINLNSSVAHSMPATRKESLPPKSSMSLSFLDLPAEIRLEIYALLLVFPQEVTIRREISEHHLEHEYQLERPPPFQRFRLANNFFWLREIAPNNLLYPVELALLQTCMTLYNEAAPILYGKNTFSFGTDAAWEVFQLFTERLTKNKHHLRNLQFRPTTLLHHSHLDERQLSNSCRGALTVVNHLPGINLAQFIIDTNISIYSCMDVVAICRLLLGTPCELILEERGWGKCPEDFAESPLPKIHRVVVATFEKYQWKLPASMDIVDKGDALSHSCWSCRSV